MGRNYLREQHLQFALCAGREDEAVPGGCHGKRGLLTCMDFISFLKGTGRFGPQGEKRTARPELAQSNWAALAGEVHMQQPRKDGRKSREFPTDKYPKGKYRGMKRLAPFEGAPAARRRVKEVWIEAGSTAGRKRPEDRRI